MYDDVRVIISYILHTAQYKDTSGKLNIIRAIIFACNGQLYTSQLLAPFLACWRTHFLLSSSFHSLTFTKSVTCDMDDIDYCSLQGTMKRCGNWDMSGIHRLTWDLRIEITKNLSIFIKKKDGAMNVTSEQTNKDQIFPPGWSSAKVVVNWEFTIIGFAIVGAFLLRFPLESHGNFTGSWSRQPCVTWPHLFHSKARSLPYTKGIAKLDIQDVTVQNLVPRAGAVIRSELRKGQGFRLLCGDNKISSIYSGHIFNVRWLSMAVTVYYEDGRSSQKLFSEQAKLVTNSLWVI